MGNVVPESWRVSPFTSSLWHCHLQGVTCPGSHSYSMPMLHSPIAISLVFPLVSSFCWLLSLGQYLFFHDFIIISLIRILNSLPCTLSLIREFPVVCYYAIEAALSKLWFNLKPQSLILKSVSPFMSSFPSDLSCTKTKSPVSLLEFRHSCSNWLLFVRFSPPSHISLLSILVKAHKESSIFSLFWTFQKVLIAYRLKPKLFTVSFKDLPSLMSKHTSCLTRFPKRSSTLATPNFWFYGVIYLAFLLISWWSSILPSSLNSAWPLLEPLIIVINYCFLSSFYNSAYIGELILSWFYGSFPIWYWLLCFSLWSILS